MTKMTKDIDSNDVSDVKNANGSNSSFDGAPQDRDQNILIKVQATPNPNAWKFVVNRSVKTEGKKTFNKPEEAENLPLITSLFQIEGVTQVYLFRNVITVTHSADLKNIEDWQKNISSVLKTRLPIHNPDFILEEEKKRKQKDLTPELKQIDEILDRTVRSALQGDGGDIEVLDLKDNRLTVRYEGACGSCPSAMTGTLMAIEGILQDEFHPEIEVIPLFDENNPPVPYY